MWGVHVTNAKEAKETSVSQGSFYAWQAKLDHNARERARFGETSHKTLYGAWGSSYYYETLHKQTMIPGIIFASFFIADIKVGEMYFWGQASQLLCSVSQDICPDGKENTIDPENIKTLAEAKKLWRRIVYSKTRGCYTHKFDSFVWTFGMTKMPRIFLLLPLFKFSEIYDSGTLYDFPERQLCDTWLSLARTFAVTPLNTLTLPNTPDPLEHPRQLFWTEAKHNSQTWLKDSRFWQGVPASVYIKPT